MHLVRYFEQKPNWNSCTTTCIKTILLKKRNLKLTHASPEERTSDPTVCLGTLSDVSVVIQQAGCDTCLIPVSRQANKKVERGLTTRETPRLGSRLRGQPNWQLRWQWPKAGKSPFHSIIQVIVIQPYFM